MELWIFPTCSLTAVSVKPTSLVRSDTVNVTGTAVYNSKDVAAANKVTFTPAAITSGNYRLAATETIDINAAITQKSLDESYVKPNTVDDQTYTGSQIKPAVTVTDGTALTSADYTVTYGANIAVGTGTVIITPKNNYSGSAISKSFNIVKASALTPKSGALDITNNYGKTYSFDLSQLLPTVAAPASLGTVTYAYKANTINSNYANGTPAVNGSNLSIPIKAVGSTSTANIGTITITIKSTNYADMDATITLSTINKKTPTGAPTLSKNTITYGEALSSITLGGSMVGMPEYRFSEPISSSRAPAM